SECSHKVIEKRRRDRINKCLADLGHIVPKAQGNGKLEKAEVLELTVEYITSLHNASNKISINSTNSDKPNSQDKADQPTVCTKRELQSYSKGYSDCKNEVLHFMDTVHATDPQLPCFQHLMAHLRNNSRMLVGIGSEKKDHHHSESAESIKQHGHNKRGFSHGESHNGGPKAKRSRDKPKSQTKNTVASGNSSDAPKPPSISLGMNLEDKMKAAFRNGNSSTESGMNCDNEDRNDNNDNKGIPNSSLPAYPNTNLFPFSNHGYPPSYGFPSYALYPAGTHYIPIPLHPGVHVQLPGKNLGGLVLPVPIIAPGVGYLGSHIPGMSTLPMGGGFSNPLSGLVPPYLPMGSVGEMTSGLKGPEGLPAYLAQEKKQENRERVQDSSGSSENDSSGDEYNFSTTSSSNLSEIGIQTDHPNDHSDYYSAGSR
ncbi:hypothetical protein QZH41_012698, partial [Actinostola sp. cb2023]